MAKEASVGKKGPEGGVGGSVENSSKGGMANAVITNRGVPGGRTLENMIGAEKVSGPSAK